MPTKAELLEDVKQLKEKLLEKEEGLRLEMLEGLVNFIHLQACTLNHDDDHECEYYIEISMEHTWERPAHKLWLEQTERILEFSNLDPIAAEDQVTIAAVIKQYRLLQIVGSKGVYFMQRLLEL